MPSNPPFRISSIAREPSAPVFADNPEFDSGWVRLGYQSLTTPSTTFRYLPQRRRLERLRQVPVPTYDAAQYKTERRTATAPDGTIEAVSVRGADTFAIGVQWHPEYKVMDSLDSRKLFSAFGDAARAHAARRRASGPKLVEAASA